MQCRMEVLSSFEFRYFDFFSSVFILFLALLVNFLFLVSTPKEGTKRWQKWGAFASHDRDVEILREKVSLSCEDLL